ncbi:MAG: L-aspartate oxidase [Planctomycetes bacterium]|nr:L-aspartate oxidase [Planctomycetota bacterium]
MRAPHGTGQFPHRLAPFDLRRTPVLRTELLVVGAGIAGACAALHAADAGAEVLLLVKDHLDETNTAWAQGGIAVVQRPDDSLANHIADTLRVGAGIAEPAAVREIVNAASDAVAWLEHLGTRFDRDDGALLLSREGGHGHARVVHANGDATGAEIQRALVAALATHPRITVRSGVFVRDLVVEAGRCVGAIVLQDELEFAIEAGAVLLATGGTGQIYRETTNPPGASGDGQALCFRAGARLADCEFVQFHPTTLYIAGASRFLISEVLRGAGAVLRDRSGQRFMDEVHPMAELAPRDVVSRAILDRMVATNDTHVYLDLSGIDGDVRRMFPSIARICATFDLDLARDPIPVRPGAHYFLGGAATDLDGHTSIPGLFAVGECAASGVHGANRLASNSLLEGAVLGRRAGVTAAAMAREPHPGLPRRGEGPSIAIDPPRLLHDDLLYSLKSLMWRQVGLSRDAQGLDDARTRIAFWHHYLLRAPLPNRRVCELANMLTVAALVAEAGFTRDESRGTHFRSDRPQRDDAAWCRRIFLERTGDGRIHATAGPHHEPTDPSLSKSPAP